MSSAAKDLKERGNQMFQLNRFEDALSYYDKAIIRDSNEASYFTNRALCYLRLKKWDRAMDDCRKAMELDPKNVKANYYYGKACVHSHNYDEAIKVLTRACDLSLAQKLAYGDEIAALVRHARREKFRIEEEKRCSQEVELQSYLNRLMDDDLQRRVNSLLESSNANGDSDEGLLMEEIDSIKNDVESKRDELNNLFAQVDDRRRKRDVPDYLCGKISFEIMHDPVITPSGITYDRESIKDHLHRVGHFDPITRAPLTVDQLIPNLAMKEVVDMFLQENEWAHDA
uniref:E3 ubiquitin-protein ligase CHIP n=1 Tax=Steinernema glaseri TaxID=37863 RepID=A0A1I8A328_9BILA